jgi:hypothetical protein
MQPSNSQLIVYAISAVAFVVLISFRMRRMMRSTPFNINFVWIMPTIMLALTIWLMARAEPRGAEWLWAVGLLIGGGVLGWMRGRSITMTVDPATHRIMAQGSASAMIFLVVLLVARYGLRYAMSTEANVIGVRPAMVDVLFLVLALGLFGVRSVEMGVRGYRLLRAAKAAPPSALADVP